MPEFYGTFHEGQFLAKHFVVIEAPTYTEAVNRMIEQYALGWHLLLRTREEALARNLEEVKFGSPNFG